MAAKRTGLGRGIGALIPMAPESSEARPVDVFFPGAPGAGAKAAAKAAAAQAATESGVGLVDGAEEVSGEALVEVLGLRLIQVSPMSIVPNPRQPRSHFDPEDLAELVHSVREFGVLQPVVVRPLDEASGTYELIMGERRLRASREAGLETIPAVVRDTADEFL